MSSEQEPQTQAPPPYVLYTLLALTVVAITGFIILFNFTTFFRLAVPL